MSRKIIQFVTALIVLVSLAGNTGVASAGRGPGAQQRTAPRAVQPQSIDSPASTITPASSLGVQFVQVATAENIYASYTTIIDHPLTNGNPNAIIIVTPNDNPGNTSGVNDPHPIGVMYSSGKWAIFNQDSAAMPVGASFNVIIPTAGAGVFVQKTTIIDTSTDINNALANSHPNARILVTPNYNPGGACPCVGADFNIGVEYHGIKWAIFAQDGSVLPLHAAFNVFILPAVTGVFVQKSTVGNTTNIYSTAINNALTNGNPNALLFVTPDYNPGGIVMGTGDDHPVGVMYDGSKWEVYHQDLTAIPIGTAFNVLVLVPASSIFVQRTTAANVVSSTTIIDNALTNYHDNAIFFATPNLNPGGVGGTFEIHNIGVAPVAAGWRIVNQDLAAMPLNTAFNVLIPNPDAAVFVHTASTANIIAHTTVLDYPLTNGNPNAVLFVTPNFAPGGVCGCVYQDHPIGVLYDGTNWRVFNQDGAAMPVGAAFNVFVATPGAAVFVHHAALSNITSNSTEISNPLANGHPNAILLVTPNWNPGNVGGTTDNHPIGVYYDGIKWMIFNQDNAAMPDGAAFNVYVSSPPTTFKSIAAQDGWVLESSENSNAGGTRNATASTIQLGDSAAKQQYRGILSFNTSSLPDTAVISAVTLKLKSSAIVGGGNPVTAFQGFMVDIKQGVFGTTALQTVDFQATAGHTYGPFKPAAVSGWYTINLTAAQAYVNKLALNSGLTQIRLRFQLDDNNDALANYLSLFSGNAAAANRPQLIITYSVP